MAVAPAATPRGPDIPVRTGQPLSDTTDVPLAPFEEPPAPALNNAADQHGLGSPPDPMLVGNRVPANPISRLVSNFATNVHERIAWADAKLRRMVALWIVGTFIVANGIVLLGVWFMFQQEMAALRDHVYAAGDRVISSQLLMVVVSATTVQLGALTILMGKYLFPAPKQ